MMTLSMDMMNRFAGLKKFVTVPLDIYLCITAVLKKYQTCLLISERDTEFVFNGKSLLFRLCNQYSCHIVGLSLLFCF